MINKVLHWSTNTYLLLKITWLLILAGSQATQNIDFLVSLGMKCEHVTWSRLQTVCIMSRTFLTSRRQSLLLSFLHWLQCKGNEKICTTLLEHRGNLEMEVQQKTRGLVSRGHTPIYLAELLREMNICPVLINFRLSINTPTLIISTNS